MWTMTGSSRVMMTSTVLHDGGEDEMKNRSIADMKDRSNLRRDMHRKAKRFLEMKRKQLRKRGVWYTEPKP